MIRETAGDGFQLIVAEWNRQAAKLSKVMVENPPAPADNTHWRAAGGRLSDARTTADRG